MAEAVEEDKHEVEHSSSSDFDQPFDDCGGENMAQVLLNQEIEKNKQVLDGIDQKREAEIKRLVFQKKRE